MAPAIATMTLIARNATSTNSTDIQDPSQHYHASLTHASLQVTIFFALASTALTLATILLVPVTGHQDKLASRVSARIATSFAALTFTLMSGVVHVWTAVELFYFPYRLPVAALNLPLSASFALGVVAMFALSADLGVAIYWYFWLYHDVVMLVRDACLRREARKIEDAAPDAGAEGVRYGIWPGYKTGPSGVVRVPFFPAVPAQSTGRIESESSGRNESGEAK